MAGFCKYAKRIIGAVVTIGVGKTCRNILELSQSYRSARVAVSYRVIYGASRAINIMSMSLLIENLYNVLISSIT